MNIKRNAFTMIELIFIILILGVLAAIAIPKFAATRDDAKTSRMAHNIMTTAFEISTFVVSKANVEADFTVMSNTAKLMNNLGTVTLSNYKADYNFGNVSPCVTLEVQNPNAQIVYLSIAVHPAGGDDMCTAMQGLIDDGVFPIKLKGSSVSY
ncbi:hypothetical protein WCX18_03005 [Sulfurimonas sp. HSL1-2]|uniref:hypothetical protein n=1 Tax=Thiomicrolovo zhangzhouensis TaxID=3131933 RepID=UPI0031F73E7E